MQRTPGPRAPAPHVLATTDRAADWKQGGDSPEEPGEAETCQGRASPCKAPLTREGTQHKQPHTHPGCRMTSSYKAFCRLERRHFRTCSNFFVSCFSTSLLVLLKINGCVTCKRNMILCFFLHNDVITHRSRAPLRDSIPPPQEGAGRAAEPRTLCRRMTTLW